MNFSVKNENEMMELGELLGRCLQPGDLLFLNGDLGAGKTTLAKGIALGTGVDEAVTSPTFQLKKTYYGDQILNHLDLYRLETAEQLDILEPEEMLDEGIVLVEWGSLLRERLQDECLEITIIKRDDDSREVCLEAMGARYSLILKELENADFRD